MFTNQYGVIPASGTISVKVGGRSIPFTATLTSTAANRSIAYSTNNLKTPAAPATPDTTMAGMINFAFMAPVTDVVFTGTPGDEWSV